MVAPRGGMHGCSQGVCVVFLGGMHSYSWGNVHGFSGGACVIAPRGHAWLLPGGMHGCSWGGVHGFSGGVCIGYDEIWSMSGRHVSYWNAFLFND